MPTSPTIIDPAPDVPVRSNPEATFEAMFEAFLTWLKNIFAPWLNVIAGGVYANAQEATQAATIATAQAATAVAAVNAPKWAAGDYTEGQCSWSPSNGRVYRRQATGASATDPADDLAHWWDIASLSGRPIVVVGAGTTVAAPGVHYILTSGASVLQLPTAELFASAAIEVTDLSLSATASVDPQTNKLRATTGALTIRQHYFHHTFQWTANAAIGWV